MSIIYNVRDVIEVPPAPVYNFKPGDKIVSRFKRFMGDAAPIILITALSHDGKFATGIVLRSDIEQGLRITVNLEHFDLLPYGAVYIHSDTSIKVGDMVRNWMDDIPSRPLMVIDLENAPAYHAECVNVQTGETSLHPLDELSQAEYHIIFNTGEPNE